MRSQTPRGRLQPPRKMSNTVTRAIVSTPRYGIYIRAVRKKSHVWLKVQNVTTQLSLPSFAKANQQVVNTPSPEVLATSLTLDKVASFASDDKVCKFRKHLIESNCRIKPDLLTFKVSLVQRPWFGARVHAITMRLNHNPFISPLPTRTIELSTLMSTGPYRPRRQR